MSRMLLSALLLLTVEVSRASFIPRSEGLNPALPTAKVRQSLHTEALELDEDLHQSQRCCPAGTHVNGACKDSGENTCSPCTDGEDYTAHSNGLPHCLPCTRCKPDEEQVSRCSTTQNTQCQCKKGTFCPPDHPCEVCQSCMERCPTGETLISPCNATADAQCARPTEWPTTEQSQGWIIAGPVIVVVLALLTVSYCLWKKVKRHSRDGSCLRVLGNSVARVSRLLEKGCPSGDQETGDNIRNSTIQPFLTPGKGSHGTHDDSRPTDTQRLAQNSTPAVYRLIPVDGNLTELRDTFDVFTHEVPGNSWKEFARRLSVPENDIYAAIQENPQNIYDQHFQMLTCWHNRVGLNASVDTLLDTLREMDLGGVAEKITGLLLKKSMYTLGPESRDISTSGDRDLATTCGASMMSEEFIGSMAASDVSTAAGTA